MTDVITKRLLEVFEMSRRMGVHSALAFEKRTKIATSSINKWRTGTVASLDSVSKVLYAFPSVSAEWLLRGEGTMDKGDDTSTAKDTEPIEENQDLISQLRDENKFLRDQLATALNALKHAHEHYNK